MDQSYNADAERAAEARRKRFGRVEQVIWIGVGANILLAVGKLAAGWLGRSEAVFADGVESVCDLGVSLATLLAVRVSRQPSDAQHPYGHGKAESLTAAGVGLIILATGVWIFISAVHAGFNHLHAPRPAWFAVAAAAITIAIKEAMARFTFAAGKATGSPLLGALATDHRKDAVTSVATVIGAGGAALGVALMDPIAAGLTALFIFKTGWECLSSAWEDLMDRTMPEELRAELSAVCLTVPGIEHVHEIKGRKSGQMFIVDLKLEMDPEMTVRRSHDIGRQVKRKIFDGYPAIGDVMIHVNPHDDGKHEDLIRL